MSKTPPTLPKYLHHKPSNRAYVRVRGRFIYLGRYGSENSHSAYAKVVSDCLAGLPVGPPARTSPTEQTSLTIRNLAVRYIEYANGYYVKGGKITNEAGMVTKAVERAVELFGDLPADQFGPLALEAVRDRLVKIGLARSTVNGSVRRIRRMFRWAGAKQLVPATTYGALILVEGLKAGRTDARETKPIQPINDKIVESTLENLSEVVADMVRLQRFTGMRPGELLILRPCDVDRSGEVWTYRPESHKTEHHGRERVVFIGPRGQAVLLRYLVRDAKAYCFRPVDSEAKRRAEQHAARKTPLSCGNRPGTNVKASPLRKVGEKYTCGTYRQAIHRACDKAKVKRWAPNQLRHSFATEVRRDHGLEAAQVTLGHSTAKTSEIYAEKNLEAGAAVARAIG